MMAKSKKKARRKRPKKTGRTKNRKVYGGVCSGEMIRTILQKIHPIKKNKSNSQIYTVLKHKLTHKKKFDSHYFHLPYILSFMFYISPESLYLSIFDCMQIKPLILIIACVVLATSFQPLIKTETPFKSREELPTNFWWGNVNGTNFLTVQKNQHIPQYCGSCWSFAVTSSLSDRIKIMRNASWPDINLAPQVLLSCDTVNHGCYGGNPPLAYKWIHENNITDETCSPYQALGHTTGLGCSAEIKCKNCSSSACASQSKAKIYTVGQYGVITQK